LNENSESSIVDNVVYFDFSGRVASGRGVAENATNRCRLNVAMHQAGRALAGVLKGAATDADGAKPQQRAA
jgi:hypothetical protein